MKYIQHLLTAGILACLVSCSNDKPSVDGPIALNTTIGQIAAKTKSGISDVPALKDKNISIIALNKEAGESGYGANGRAGTYVVSATGGVVAVESKDIWLLKERATIFATFPAADITINNSTPTVAISTESLVLNPVIVASATREDFDFVSSNHDYMYGVTYDEVTNFSTSQPFADNGKTGQAAAINTFGPKISIGFKHAFAQISIVVKGGNYVGDGILESVSYTRDMPKLAATTAMSLVDGELLNLESVSERSYAYDLKNLTIPLKLTTEAATNVVLANYAIPMASSNAKIKLVVDQVAMEVAIPNDKAWKAGSIYVYTVTVNNMGLSIDGVSVVQWNENQIGNVVIN